MKWLIVQVKTVECGRFHTIRQAQHLCQALHKAWGTHCEPWIKKKMPLISQSLHPNAGDGKLPSKQIKEKTYFWSMTVLCRKRDYVECNHQNVGPGDSGVREILSEKTTWWHSSWDLNDDSQPREYPSRIKTAQERESPPANPSLVWVRLPVSQVPANRGQGLDTHLYVDQGNPLRGLLGGWSMFLPSNTPGAILQQAQEEWPHYFIHCIMLY